ncbi:MULTISPECIES: response regulator [Dactylosporangium]|uniref:DNA-binding response regulator n=2 Tax=Dactylosporangium TaxID=35753 RepID=A0A9W6NM40_9ACTN|nr:MULTISPECIES: response regulator transcription factor [Dactylosporangium]UAC00725.1 response regulator transcription factor [Dactylosporangium vinaceum]UWZ48286.1 response regulator transcription factor [Dactylosporangium matsuzakiense]GLL01527.1 DNA-binding response regulator [Dactylosporangium matsuzakiense]
MITVLVVDDNPSVRATLRPLLESHGTISVVAEAGNGRAALTAAARLKPRVTLLDQRMPVADGLSVIDELARLSSVLVLTGSADPALVAPMLRGGARGYLVYGQFDPPDLVAAIHAVAAGQGWLTPTAASIAASAMRDAYARERVAADRARAHRAAQQRYGLTEREEEVVDLLCAGLSNAGIAQRLAVSEKTVKNHLNRVFAKLGVLSRTEAAARWQGWT